MDSGAESTAKIGTFDLNKEAAQAVKDGKIQFCIDQQPYLQGYMAITQLYLYKKNGNVLGGGKAVLTGPSFVDKSNIDAILPFIEAEHPLVRIPRGPGRADRPAPADTALGATMSHTCQDRPQRRRPSEASNRVTLGLSNRLLARPEVGALVAAIVIFIFFLIVAPAFRSPPSFFTVLYQSSTIGIVAVGGRHADDRWRVRPVRRRPGHRRRPVQRHVLLPARHQPAGSARSCRWSSACASGSSTATW